MTTQEIANRLIELCRNQEFDKAQTELFSDDAVSIEPNATPAFEKETKGLQAIKEKGKKWSSMVEETHSFKVSEPLIAPNSFCCTMKFDVTMKERGRMDMTEIGVFKIKDGKIISEEFFM